jgi:hypothetical protein
MVTGAKVEGERGQSAPASRTPPPGSESGADVQQVIRERERTHSLWKQRAAYGNGGVQNDRAFTGALKGKEANTGKWRRHETRGTLPVPPNEGKRNEAGRMMSSRSVVIVPMKQGNRNQGTLTCARREGLHLEKDLLRGNTNPVHRD